MPKISWTCEGCGVEKQLWPSRAVGRKYCTQSCASRSAGARAANDSSRRLPCPNGCGRLLQSGLVRRHSSTCLSPFTLEKLRELAGVATDVDDETCWLWHHYKSGKLIAYPYVTGMPTANIKGNRRASHVAFEFLNGISIVGIACHTCDQSACVNPRHIYDGDHSTNGLDSYARDLTRKRGGLDEAAKRRFSEKADQVEYLCPRCGLEGTMGSGHFERYVVSETSRWKVKCARCGRRKSLYKPPLA